MKCRCLYVNLELASERGCDPKPVVFGLRGKKHVFVCEAKGTTFLGTGCTLFDSFMPLDLSYCRRHFRRLINVLDLLIN